MSGKVTERAMTEAEKRARVGQERNRFEVYARAKDWRLQRDPDYSGEYASEFVNDFWNGWRTRALEESNVWMSIKQRPTMGIELIAKLIDGSELHGAILQGDGDWWWHHKFFDESEVTHWRPLPSPPSAAQETGK